MFEDNNFLSFLKNKIEQKQNIVVVTIVNTQYFSFRKTGTMMIISDDRDIYGVISGGCFEDEIIDCSIEAIKNNKGKFVSHDLRVDKNAKDWDQGVGCNGIIDLWLEPFLVSRNWGGLARAVDISNAEFLSDTYLIREVDNTGGFAICQNSTLIENSTNIQDEEIVKNIKNKNSFLVEKYNLFFQKIKNPIKILLLGGGPTSSSVINISQELGWLVHVCEDRKQYQKYIQDAKYLVDFESLNGYYDAVVIMSHSFEYDVRYLAYALSSQSKYIGLMGPKQRANQILERIENKPDLTRLYNPVGLDIGSESPSEISLSICSQIQLVLTR